MSRSYKKHPCHKEQDTVTKRKFNRSIRRNARQHLSSCNDFDWYVGDMDGMFYKRLNCSWDICDWKSIYWYESDFWWVYDFYEDDEEEQVKVVYQARMK